MGDIELTSAELDELERLAKAATPGPWYQPDDINPELIFSGAPDEPAFLLAEAFREDSDADATYIASAYPATILRLLSLARAGLEAGKAEESMRERAAELADSEAELRKANGIAAEAGDTRWGRDTKAVSLAQYHKSITATLLASAIRALPLTGVDKT